MQKKTSVNRKDDRATSGFFLNVCNRCLEVWSYLKRSNRWHNKGESIWFLKVHSEEKGKKSILVNRKIRRIFEDKKTNLPGWRNILSLAWLWI